MKVFYLNILGCMFVFALAFQTTAHAEQMSLAQFQKLAGGQMERCNGGIKDAVCEEELKYALDQKFIGQDTYNWAKQNRFYPTFNTRGNSIMSVCKCGCFAKGTMIMTAFGEKRVESLDKSDQLVTLHDSADLQNPMTDIRPVESVLKGPESQKLYIFKMADGTELAVTTHHGMLLSNGKMVAAKDVKNTDAFLNAQGQVLAIRAIERAETQEDVFNVEAQSFTNGGHIIVAQNILVGDLAWQNQLQKDLNAIQLRQ